MNRLMLFLMLLVIALPCVWGQNATRKGIAASPVVNYRPVMFQTPCPATTNGLNICMIIPQVSSKLAFGIIHSSDPIETLYPAGTKNIPLATNGEVTCEFDSPPQTGYTAVALNGFCHYDPAVINDSQVCSDKSAIGRIQKLRPDLGPNFATINFRETAGRGSLLCDSSPGLKSTISANLAVQNGETDIPQSGPFVLDATTALTTLSIGVSTSFTISSGTPGQIKTISICPSVSNLLVVPPANLRGFALGGGLAGKCSTQVYQYHADQSAWLAISPAVVNQ